jgi:hypothetical protein
MQVLRKVYKGCPLSDVPPGSITERWCTGNGWPAKVGCSRSTLPYSEASVLLWGTHTLTRMTIVELIPLLAVLIGVMWVLGHFLGGTTLLIGSVPLLVLGFILVIAGVRNAITETRHVLRPRPPCRRGGCSRRNYVLVNSTPSKAAFRCRCGDLYLRDGEHFSQILPDHSLLPYMVLDASKTWRNDTRKQN